MSRALSLRLRSVFYFLVVVFGLAFTVQPAAAIDYSLPYWYITAKDGTRYELQGESDGVGMAVATWHLQYNYGVAPVVCFMNRYPATGTISAECDKYWYLYGIAYLSCGSSGKLIGYKCMRSDEVAQLCACPAPNAGNPVIVGNGSKIETVTDYSSAGNQPLALTRTYLSNYKVTTGLVASTKPNDVSRFGRAWHSPFDSSVVFSNSNPAAVADGNKAYLMLPEVKEIAFVYSASLAKWRPAYLAWGTTPAWTAPRTDITWRSRSEVVRHG